MEVLKLCVFILVASLIFPVFGYGFTTFSNEEPQYYDLSVTYDDLIDAKIIFGEGETHTVNFGSYAEYNFTDSSDVRCYWHLVLAGEWNLSSWLTFRVQNTFGRIFESFGSLMYRNHRGLLPYSGTTQRFFNNATIVNNFDLGYNWTRINLITTGYIALITPANVTDTIEDAVYTRGQLNVTIIKSLEDDTDFNVAQFVGWYGNILLGDQVFGLPPFFRWFVRVFSFLGVLSAVILFKELSKI